MRVTIPKQAGTLGQGTKGVTHYPCEDWREIAVPWLFPARMGMHHIPLVQGPWTVGSIPSKGTD